MTTKVQGTNGIEFPDGSVQGSAAYSKAQSDPRYVNSTDGAFKMKVLNGTTGNAANSTATLPHGVANTNAIKGFQPMVFGSDNYWIAAGNVHLDGNAHMVSISAFADGTNVYVRIGTDPKLFSRPVRVIVFYE
jgi:hypothetical protein